MADNVTADAGVGGATFAADDIVGVHYPRTKVVLGADGVNDGDVSSANPMPVSGPLTDAQLRATAVPVSGTVTASGPLTDAQLRATAVPVSGPLTDAQLRATAVPVSGPLTDAQLRATAVPVTVPTPVLPEPPVALNATALGDTTVIAAPGVGVNLFVNKVSIHNRGAATIVVALRDGTAGTIRWRAELAAEGGGSLIDFGPRGWKLTANTLLAVNLGAAGDVDVNVTEFYETQP